ncbi:MAG: outer membrane protein transport protein [Deltaproteobacteria bacterium]|nr:outer membrane protein transport protein [Deltaproteobacteria bacterium]MBW1720121.1 outer membrane protein transport protein [Deltaproteobacteria bacterium]MBW1938765.1 outer membrane protein transport protein [Deltaproteobacteria bacterium]MBW1965104.1 outer membrane protein transport protein [Deltaproteobacteria bacterium]MBW2081157.1 outer membrane protein transport protein [Deltaproteobacteria bacterium]
MRTAQVPRNWDDTWHFAAGLHYRINGKWLLQGGMAYDTNPVDAEDRTADMPLDRQVRFSLGVRHEQSKNVSTGFIFEYIDFGSAKIKSSSLLAGDLIGEYDKNEAFLLVFNVNWR